MNSSINLYSNSGFDMVGGLIGLNWNRKVILE